MLFDDKEIYIRIRVGITARIRAEENYLLRLSYVDQYLNGAFYLFSSYEWHTSVEAPRGLSNLVHGY